LKFQNYSAQLTTDGFSGGDVTAYENLMRTRFNPAFVFTWWLDENNYAEVIRPMFAKKLPVPFNYFYPGHFQRQVKEYLWQVYNLPAETPSEEDLNWRIIEKDVSFFIQPRSN
jgi:metaxin